MSNFGRRSILAGVAAALAAPALTGHAQAQAIALPNDVSPLSQNTVTRVATEQPHVALTFDDGPHPTLTPQLLDILAARNVRATFYVIGRNAARYPQILQRIAAEGHEIGNHTWSHPSLFGYGQAGLLDQMDRTSQAIEAATGRPPVTMRPPYGNLHSWQRQFLYEARGLPTILWSVDTRDWQRPGSWVVADRMVRGGHTGAVMLAHDIHGATVRAIPDAIDGLAARGFRFVQVSELLGWPRWDRRRIRTARVSTG